VKINFLEILAKKRYFGQISGDQVSEELVNPHSSSAFLFRNSIFDQMDVPDPKKKTMFLDDDQTRNIQEFPKAIFKVSNQERNQQYLEIRPEWRLA